mmetsp:Transcript_44720/g.111310  ORF Transcript_44720/g.111310 Transcript_44720/m.111310 type:complete len:255 (+) Transcript_44720:269-1033(+)
MSSCGVVNKSRSKSQPLRSRSFSWARMTCTSWSNACLTSLDSARPSSPVKVCWLRYRSMWVTSLLRGLVGFLGGSRTRRRRKCRQLALLLAMLKLALERRRFSIQSFGQCSSISSPRSGKRARISSAICAAPGLRALARRCTGRGSSKRAFDSSPGMYSSGGSDRCEKLGEAWSMCCAILMRLSCWKDATRYHEMSSRPPRNRSSTWIPCEVQSEVMESIVIPPWIASVSFTSTSGRSNRSAVLISRRQFLLKK